LPPIGIIDEIILQLIKRLMQFNKEGLQNTWSFCKGKSFTKIIAKNNSMIFGIIEDKQGTFDAGPQLVGVAEMISTLPILRSRRST
jgi:hypothetical protein